MADEFTNEDKTAAAARGWQLCLVFDDRKKTWAHRALPLTFGTHCLHAPALVNMLVTGAKSMDALSLKALRLMAAPIKTKGRKK